MDEKLDVNTLKIQVRHWMGVAAVLISFPIYHISLAELDWKPLRAGVLYFVCLYSSLFTYIIPEITATR